MYTLIIPNNVKRDLKRLEKQAQKDALGLLSDLSACPNLGINLAGQFQFLYKVEFKCLGVQYRIAYTISEIINEINIIHIGTRENFYQELKRRL